MTHRINYLQCAKYIAAQGDSIMSDYIGDLGYGHSKGEGNKPAALMKNCSPCLTKNHCGSNEYYCFARQRFLLLLPLLLLLLLRATR
jgi:hypothetical protein